MKTNNTQNISITATVDQFLGDVILANLAIRYTNLGNKPYARRAYRIESEMAAIASEVGNHARIPQHQIECFLVALAKTVRPGPEALSLPECEEMETRSAEQRFLSRIEKPVKVAVMADWSPSRNVEVAL